VLEDGSTETSSTFEIPLPSDKPEGFTIEEIRNALLFGLTLPPAQNADTGPRTPCPAEGAAQPKKRRPGARSATPVNQLPEMSIQRGIKYCKDYLGWNIGRGYLNRAIYEGRLPVVKDFTRKDNQGQPRVTIRRADLDALKASSTTYGPATAPPPPNVKRLKPAAIKRSPRAHAGGAK